MKEKSILEQLQAPEFKASKTDRILMEYIRANVENVPHTAIAHLAADSGVGEATITRFVKKMGFPNLSGFKLALARELTESSHRYIINNNIEAGESALETGRKLLDVNIGTLEKTLESLSDGVIERCAALMCAAKRLQFIGLGNSGFIAQDSAYKFYRIGLESFGLDNGHSMMIMAALARPGDVVAAVSHSGHSPEVLKAVRLAKENGATIIAITANRTSPLCEISNLVVPYQAEETLLETGSISVKIAQFFIMDLIYTQIVKEKPEMAVENKKRTTQAVNLLQR